MRLKSDVNREVQNKKVLEQDKRLKDLLSGNAEALPDERLKKFLVRHPEAVIYTPSGKAWGTEKDLTTAQWMFNSRVSLINPTAKTPLWASWANEIRLMVTLDGRSHQEICNLFDWANKNSFWCTNILSPLALRKHWEQLTLQKQSPSKGLQQKAEINFRNTDWAKGLKI
ncbi:Uncharacterised protein [Yersinia frederiksenii]|nr:Uncharacterised protein [Yersinia frederiksenii]